jgi:hypothetical protein
LSDYQKITNLLKYKILIVDRVWINKNG